MLVQSSFRFRSVLVGVLSLALVCCGGSASPPSVSAEDDQGERSNGADAGDGAEDAGCGLSFGEALEAFEPERVCQTTIYNPVSGYCTHWVACSSL
jgi:hypothetical protein